METANPSSASNRSSPVSATNVPSGMPSHIPSHIVGVGASAGGLEALEHFFANMPAQNGMAFVVVQHLSPDFKSLMDQLLGRHTQMAIRRVEDGMPVEADTIYLIPPRSDIVITNRTLNLTFDSL